MDGFYHWLISGIWLVWGAYWLVSARHVQKTRRSEPPVQRFIHLALTAGAFGLLAVCRT